MQRGPTRFSSCTRKRASAGTKGSQTWTSRRPISASSMLAWPGPRRSPAPSRSIPDMRTAIGINGVCGRMGMRILQLAQEDAELQVIAALDSPQNPQQGKDAGVVAGLGPIGVPVRAEIDLSTRLDAVIDFS